MKERTDVLAKRLLSGKFCKMCWHFVICRDGPFCFGPVNELIKVEDYCEEWKTSERNS
jgi:hypothetical protein